MFFECEYCKKKFKSELNHKKHLCEKKKKLLLANSKHGQIAYICYENWRKLKGYYTPTKETFANSKFFKSFINFVEFCNKKSIPEKNGFINAMVMQDVPPSLWANDAYYDFYIKNFDIIYTPLRQVEISLENIYKLASILECGPEKVFEKVSMIDILRLIVVKKLSPWLLLFMKSFQNHIAYGITEEERNLLDTIIDVRDWKNRLLADPKSTEKIKALMTSLNI